MAEKLRESKSWLLWTGLLLVTLIVAVLLASGSETSQAALSAPGDVEMNKSVSVPYVEPGQVPAPQYTLTFTNNTDVDVILDAVTDTLPASFDFLGMHPASDWLKAPSDEVEPEIVWTGPVTVPASGSLAFIYSVYVPGTVSPSTTPYENTAEAVEEDGTPLGPVSAPLLVGSAALSVDKVVAPEGKVLHGGLVTYTVTLANSGQVPGTLHTVTDTLDPALSYVGLAPDSGVTDLPEESGNTLVWRDLEVPAGGALTIKYVAQAPAGTGWSTVNNQVEAVGDDGTLLAETSLWVGPERGYFYFPTTVKNHKPAFLAMTKSVFPDTVEPGGVATYTVTIENVGDEASTLLTVDDVLPPGFTYVDMVPGSDVLADPAGTMGPITWSGNWNMASGAQLQLIYKVTAGAEEGNFVNSVTLTGLGGGVQQEPATATIAVERGVLLEDNFNGGINQWTKFLNYWRLKDEQWYWGPGDGFAGSGAVTHDCTLGKTDPERGAEDALLMYLGAGSDQWTDYRVETKVLLRGGMSDGEWVLEGGYPVGLWVRGQYQDVGDEDTAGWVTGYYLVIGGKTTKDMFVRLAQLQTLTDCWDQACDNPQNLYDFNNPHELWTNSLDFSFERNRWYTLVVEVRGNRIMAWVDGVLGMDYTDTKEPFLTGTVGLKTYKSWTVSFDDIIVTPLH